MKKLNEEQSIRLKSVLKSALTLLIVGLIYFVFVKITHLGIPCVFNLITGLHCPGCGISRMFLSLASLDFKAAFGYNALIMIIGPFFLFFSLKYYIKYILTGNQKTSRFEDVLLVIALVLTIAFGVLRNLPAFSFLAP